jgi:hypothetical protein
MRDLEYSQVDLSTRQSGEMTVSLMIRGVVHHFPIHEWESKHRTLDFRETVPAPNPRKCTILKQWRSANTY